MRGLSSGPQVDVFFFPGIWSVETLQQCQQYARNLAAKWALPGVSPSELEVIAESAAIDAFESYDPEKGSLKVWIYTCVHARIRKEHRFYLTGRKGAVTLSDKLEVTHWDQYDLGEQEERVRRLEEARQMIDALYPLLTKREQRILHHKRYGWTNADIARRHRISRQSVYAGMKRIREKAASADLN